MKLKENRSGLLAFLLNILTFYIFGIIQAFQMAHEINITCAADGKKTRNPLTAFLITLLLSLLGVGWIYWLIYQYSMVSRMQDLATRSGEKAKLTATSWLLGLFLGVFTFMIWPLINYFKKYALWNQCNRIHNASGASQAA